MRREFTSIGAEALAPPVDQKRGAAYTCRSSNFEYFRLQFGGRMERNDIHPKEQKAEAYRFFRSRRNRFPLWQKCRARV